MTDAPAPRPRRFQRLASAFAAHNWFSVAVEIAIVTVGVLLAFEIEQWGQRRERAAEERQFLERLHFEYGRSANETQSLVDRHTQVMSDLGVAFAARNSSPRLVELSRRIDFGCGGGQIRTSAFNDTAFQEMVSSGRLSLVNDDRLRGAIRDLTTAQASMKDRAALGQQVALDQAPYLTPYYRYDLMPDGRTTCRVEWPALFRDQAAVTGTIRTYRMHELIRNGLIELVASLVRVRKVIACKLGKPECRR